MSTPIEQLQAYKAANPSARLWVDEVLIRGAASDDTRFGIIKGAQFTIGVELADPLGGVAKKLLGPFPAEMVPTGDTSSMSELIGTLMVTQQQTIDQQTSTLAERDATITALNAQLEQQRAAANAQVDGLNSQLAAAEILAANRADEVSDRDATIATQNASLVSKDARIAELEAALAATAQAEASE